MTQDFYFLLNSPYIGLSTIMKTKKMLLIITIRYRPLYRAFYICALLALFESTRCYRPLYRAFYNKILCLLHLSFLYLDTSLLLCQYFPQKVGQSLFSQVPKSLYLSHFLSFPILLVRPTDFLSLTYSDHHHTPLLSLLPLPYLLPL
jgi:hypothetical protein